MNTTDQQLEDRYQFIDFLLFFKGRLQRNELVGRFNIGAATASRTISSFCKRFPVALVYEGARKGYSCESYYSPQFRHETETGLRYLAEGAIVERFAVNSFGPSPISVRKTLDPETVATITRAMVSRKQVIVEYISSSSGAKSRSVSAHSLFQAGGAWYFRAFDFSSREFRTFKFSRVQSALLMGEQQPEADIKNDDEWHRLRTVRLIAHPKHKIRSALALDLDIDEGESKELIINEALLGFTLVDLRVDCSLRHKLDSNQYPLALDNRHELESVGSMTIAPGY